MAFLSGYTYRIPITIDHTKFGSTETNFVIPVKFTGSPFDFSKPREDGYDVIFTDSDGETLLKFDRDYYAPDLNLGSDFTAGATVTASGTDGGAASNVIDNNDSTYWYRNSSAYWVKIDLGSGVTKTARQINLKPWGDGTGVGCKQFTVSGSNDDSTYITLGTFNHGNNTNYEAFTFANTTAYRYYKIEILSNWRSGNPTSGLYELELKEASGLLTTGSASYRVKVPSISNSVDGTIYLYYGKSSASDSADPTNVYDSYRKLEMHLKESGDGTANEYKDSTSNANHGCGGNGTASYVPIATDSLWYKGQLFDGSNDYIQIADTSTLELSNSDFRIRFILNFTSTSGNQCFLGRYTGGSSYFYFAREGSGIRFRDYVSGNVVDFSATWSPSTSTNYIMEVVRSGTSWKIYANGTEIASTTASATLTDRSEGWQVGACNGISYYTNAIIDELAIDIGTARTDNWRSADRACLNNTVLTFGTEEENVNEVVEEETFYFSEDLELTETREIDDGSFTLSESSEILASTVLDIDEGSLNLSEGIELAEDYSKNESLTISESSNIFQSLEKILENETFNISESSNIQNIIYLSNAVRIISYNPLVIISCTEPVNLAKIDITDPENPTWDIYTLNASGETIKNAKDIVFNDTFDYLYIVGDEGKVLRINIADYNDRTEYDVSNLNSLDIVGSLDIYHRIYAASEKSTGQLVVLDFAELAKIKCDFRLLVQQTKKIITYFSLINGAKIKSDFRVASTQKTKLKCDFRLFAYDYDLLSSNLMKRTDFKVYLDDIELTDVILQTINIYHSADEKSRATFSLARYHDKLNYTIDNISSVITENNNIKIYIQDRLEFEGQIYDIDSDSMKEIVDITAYGDIKDDNRNTVLLPLSTPNAQIHPYHVLLNNPKIYEPVVDINDENPEYYKGIQIDLGERTEQNWSDWRSFGIGNLNADQINDGDFNYKQNWTYYWIYSTILNWLTGTEQTYLYIGTSLSPIMSDSFQLISTQYIYNRKFDDKVSQLGYYQIGEAPYQTISAKNGQFITKEHYEDKDDGLYRVKDAGYNYCGQMQFNGSIWETIEKGYAQKVADLEYQKLLTTAGTILPKTSVQLKLTIDAYYYYGISLLTRINLDNTLTAGIYKNLNGFPVSVKSIEISADDMSINLRTDNNLSQTELKEIDDLYPDETNDEYIQEETSKFYLQKSNPKTNSDVQ